MTIENKRQFKDKILADGREGTVLKKLDSLYLMGKKPMWLWMKIKQKDEADLVITGFDPPTKEYSGTDYESWPFWKDDNGVMVPVSKFYYNGWIGAIQLSAYVNGVLTKICTCSGFDEATRKDMTDNPNNYLNKVVKVTFMERTEAGYPRHPNFEEMHPDKMPDECIWDFDE